MIFIKINTIIKFFATQIAVMIIRRIDTFTYLFAVSASKELRNDHCGCAGQTGKKAHNQVDDLSRRATYCSQSIFANEPAHHDGVYSVIKLLKKGAKGNGKEEQQ